MNRRFFLQAPAVTALGAKAASAAPSDRVGIALIGCGGMGRLDLADFHRQPDVELRAVCDVHRPSAEAARKLAGGKPEIYSDFRRILDRKDIDAVVVATPDHWHPYIAIRACEAGKDVYVEKPISHNVREGRLMVDAARRHNRVVQVGIQQRSGAHFQRAVAAIQEGRIGKILFAQCWNHDYVPDPTGMGFPADSEPPVDLDWDLWLGPAPKIPYNSSRRNFRWFWDYAGGQLTNWCVHLLDVVHWATGRDEPLSVMSTGGKWHYQDCRECADTQEVVWEYPDGLLVRYSTMAHNSFGPNGHPGNKPFGSYGTMFQGTKGTLIIDRSGYEIIPQSKSNRDRNALSQRDAYDDLQGVNMYFTTEITAERGTTSQQHLPHVRNFLDCIKSRQRPIGDIEIGHKSTAACLIGNIALRTGQKLQWDARREQFTNYPDANRLLTRQYRSPWHLDGLDKLRDA